MRYILVFLNLMNVSIAYGAIEDNDFEKAQVVAEKIDQQKRLVGENENRERKILSNLFEINQRIKKISREKSQLANEKRTLEATIQELNLQIASLKFTLQVKGRELINHVRWISQTKDFAWLNLFSGSKGPSDADLNLYILTHMTSLERDRIQDYFAQKKQLQKNQEKLQARWDRLNRITQDLAVKETDFLSEQSTRKSALSEVSSQKSKLLTKIHNLKNTELAQKLEDTGLLDGLVQNSFGDEKGFLNSPLKGPLQQRFGIVKVPETSYYKNHKGIFIHSKLSPEIKSVFEGKVAFAGGIGGFGNTLIVDHGDHYYTVYSSLAGLNVHEGEFIQRDQVLGQAGTSPFYREAGVYFEVRHFSEPQDPTEWLKKGSL